MSLSFKFTDTCSENTRKRERPGFILVELLPLKKNSSCVSAYWCRRILYLLNRHLWFDYFLVIIIACHWETVTVREGRRWRKALLFSCCFDLDDILTCPVRTAAFVDNVCMKESTWLFANLEQHNEKRMKRTKWKGQNLPVRQRT